MTSASTGCLADTLQIQVIDVLIAAASNAAMRFCSPRPKLLRVGAECDSFQFAVGVLVRTLICHRPGSSITSSVVSRWLARQDENAREWSRIVANVGVTACSKMDSS